MGDADRLLDHLLGLDEHVGWLEFKQNNSDPGQIGEYVSALANSAALEGQLHGFLVWGVRDEDRQLVGTSFDPDTAKVSGEGLRNWLSRVIEPRTELTFHKVARGAVILEIPRATIYPTKFKGSGFVRVGEHKKKLEKHPELERRLWWSLSNRPFEEDLASENVSESDILDLMDYAGFFELLKESLPERGAIIERLLAEQFLARDKGTLHVTNLGAIACAKELAAWPALSRKSVRVILYKGTNKLEAEREIEGRHGYAVGFGSLIEYLQDRLPTNEAIRGATRVEHELFPIVAVRELLANALIHQDFTIRGAGPMVEVFADRIEITNPGTPLIDVQRFLDHPPRSRNEGLARFMRRCRICEERGSGIDRVVRAAEVCQLPPPDFQTHQDQVKVVLFAPKAFADMTRGERVRACYQHASLLQASGGQRMQNKTLRERFGLEARRKAEVSRVIKDAVDAKLIVIHDPTSGPRNRSYLPFWAAE